MRIKNPFNNRRHNAPRSTRLPHKNPAGGKEYEGIVTQAEAMDLIRAYDLNWGDLTLVQFLNVYRDTNVQEIIQVLLQDLERYRRGERVGAFGVPIDLRYRDDADLAVAAALAAMADERQDEYMRYMAARFRRMYKAQLDGADRLPSTDSDVDRLLYALALFKEASRRAETARIFADPNWRKDPENYRRLGLDPRKY